MPALDTLRNLDPVHALSLRRLGIRTTERLLERCMTPAGRRRLAGEVGCAESDILDWAQRADMQRVKGLGPEYGELLASLGIRKLRELARRKPARLFDDIAEANGNAYAVARMPTQSAVAAWINAARELTPEVKT